MQHEWARLSSVTDQAGKRRKRVTGRKLAVITRKLRNIRLRRTRIIVQRFKRRRLDNKRLCVNFLVATWNTRGLGAEAGEIDQELKKTSILERMRIQKWDVVGLTDLKYREDGVRKYRHAGQDRFLVVSGRVGFLMLESWHSGGRRVGGVLYARSLRVAGIQLPRRGWRRGLFLSCAYAPISAAGKVARQKRKTKTQRPSTFLGQRVTALGKSKHRPRARFGWSIIRG